MIIKVPKEYKIKGYGYNCRPCKIDRDRIDTRRGKKRTKFIKPPSRHYGIQHHEKKIRTAKAEVRYLTWLLKVTGILKKPDTCEQCGEPNDRIEAHHITYNDPANILWLCRPCHVKIHGWAVDPYPNQY